MSTNNITSKMICLDKPKEIIPNKPFVNWVGENYQLEKSIMKF